MKILSYFFVFYSLFYFTFSFFLELDLKELESKIMELYEAYNYADEL